MGEILFPFVKWAQDENNVYLNVELREIEDPEIKISDQKVEFQAIGEGAKGRNQYYFLLDLYGKLDEKDSSYRLNDTRANFVLKKQFFNENLNKEEKFWPRLTVKNEKLPWLKIDFDKWSDPNDSGDEKSDLDEKYKNFDREAYEKQQADDIVSQILKERGNLKAAFDLTKPYLITYNFIMFIGYFLIVIDLLRGYFNEKTDFFPKVWLLVSQKMFYCQMAQFLEIAHALLGYVKSSPFTASLQILGRGFVLFMILGGETRMHDKPFVFYLFFAWSLVEIIRYPYYVFAVLNKNIKIITWLRYSAWIILYPLGFLCEGVILLRAMPYYEETQKFTYPLPNFLNFSIDFTSVLKLYLLFLFFPGIVILMSHMRSLRLKKLSRKKVD